MTDFDPQSMSASDKMRYVSEQMRQVFDAIGADGAVVLVHFSGKEVGSVWYPGCHDSCETPEKCNSSVMREASKELRHIADLSDQGDVQLRRAYKA